MFDLSVKKDVQNKKTDQLGFFRTSVGCVMSKQVAPKSHASKKPEIRKPFLKSQGSHILQDTGP